MSDEQQGDSDLVPFFVPSLSAVFVAKEDEKGEPLTKSEVVEIRDNSPCIMMEVGDAEQMHESRGYRDIDPENCWHDWQMVRRELGRKPDLDPGPRFGLISDSDPKYQETIKAAQDTLNDFRRALPQDGSIAEGVSLKTELVDGERRAFMWLTNVVSDGAGFTAELFEVPDRLPAYSVGDRLSIDSATVLDWMINDQGVIYGGYSLRYQREKMSEQEQVQFDKHIGAKKYA